MKDKTKPTKKNFNKEQFEELKRSIFIRNKIEEVLFALFIITLIVALTFVTQSILNRDSVNGDAVCYFMMSQDQDCTNYIFTFWTSLGFLFLSLSLIALAAMAVGAFIYGTINLFNAWIDCNKVKADKEARRIMRLKEN